MRDRRRVSVVFAPEPSSLANGERRERLAGVQDTASQFIQLTYVFSTQPELLESATPSSSRSRCRAPWTLDLRRGRGARRCTRRSARCAAFHLKPRRADRDGRTS